MRALLVAMALGAAAPVTADDMPKRGGVYEEAADLERQGKGIEAVKLYIRAARSGNPKAAMRLSEIYEKGLLGVKRDQAESQKWNNFARTLGDRMQGGWGCPPNCGVPKK